MGIGRADSSRRVLGKKPTTLEHLEQFVKAFRELKRGQHDRSRRRCHHISLDQQEDGIWVAGSRPESFAHCGCIGDGVILQFADPDLISWCLGFVREGAKEAGCDFSKIEVMASPSLGFKRSESRARAC